VIFRINLTRSRIYRSFIIAAKFKNSLPTTNSNINGRFPEFDAGLIFWIFVGLKKPVGSDI